MSRYCDLPITSILAAAERWKQRCLTEGLSIFTDLSVWSTSAFDELKRLYIDAPDMGSGNFYDKLKGQLATASDEAKWLAVEVTWVLYLFPAKLIGIQGKRKNLELICSNAGLQLPKDHWALQDKVLSGVGNPGTYFNTGFWVELSYTLLVFRALIRLPREQREAVLQEDDLFVSWIDSLADVLESDKVMNPHNRQARHIFLFLLQPDFHERIASSTQKRNIVKKLANRAGLRPDVGSPSAIDKQLLAIRNHFESVYGTTELDFYRSPLYELWNEEKSLAVEEASSEYMVGQAAGTEPETDAGLDLGAFPRNVIFYGPPGTGKTWTLMNQVLSGGHYVSPAGPHASGEVETRYTFVTFHPSYSYEDLIEGLRPVEVQCADGRTEIQIKTRDGALKALCKRAIADPKKRFALVVDEVNRGNIAKIFGELITLMESDKRLRFDKSGKPKYEPGRSVTLPTSQEFFGIPENVDIYCTMNTADRSIALVDIALRRRFVFRELLPNPGVIAGEQETGSIPSDDDGGRIDLRRLLLVLNARLTVLRGRDACIGHAYFCKVTSIDDLRSTFRDRVIPLLQEYFYEDWEGISLVLAVSGGAKAFVEATQTNLEGLFGPQSREVVKLSEAPVWRIARSLRPDAPDDELFPASSFRALYESVPLAATDLS
ncbi:McrB family protein [Pseudoduganella sp. OTU4001]|uniref:McrB family protein n=1 Tax=Pseudoduganella sp. OTU4001 TaxID=3043854 RepID=UPI00313AA5FE